MPSILPFLPAIIGAGASIAGGALASGSKTTTTTPTLSPGMTDEQNQLLATLNQMQNPSTDSTLAPIKAAAEDQINKNYATLPNTLTAQAAARGFGSSGKVGGSLLGIDSSRLSDLSGLMGTMAQLGSQRQMSAEQMIQSILQNNTGRAVTTPSNSLASGLLSGGNALSNLAMLQTLKTMINGGGSTTSSVPATGGTYGGGGGLSSLIMPDPTGEGWG